MVGAVYILVVIVVLERKIVVGKLIQDNHHMMTIIVTLGQVPALWLIETLHVYVFQIFGKKFEELYMYSAYYSCNFDSMLKSTVHRK
jgi:hypothetical protein